MRSKAIVEQWNTHRLLCTCIVHLFGYYIATSIESVWSISSYDYHDHVDDSYHCSSPMSIVVYVYMAIVIVVNGIDLVFIVVSHKVAKRYALIYIFIETT